MYDQTIDTRLTKSPNLNVSRPVLQLPWSNLLKPGINSRKMQLEQRRQMMLRPHLGDQQFYCLRCDLYYKFDGMSRICRVILFICYKLCCDIALLRQIFECMLLWQSPPRSTIYQNHICYEILNSCRPYMLNSQDAHVMNTYLFL